MKDNSEVTDGSEIDFPNFQNKLEQIYMLRQEEQVTSIKLYTQF